MLKRVHNGQAQAILGELRDIWFKQHECRGIWQESSEPSAQRDWVKQAELDGVNAPHARREKSVRNWRDARN